MAIKAFFAFRELHQLGVKACKYSRSVDIMSKIFFFIEFLRLKPAFKHKWHIVIIPTLYQLKKQFFFALFGVDSVIMNVREIQVGNHRRIERFFYVVP